MREKSLGFILCLAVYISYCLFWSKAEENGKTRQTFVIRYKDEDQTIPVTVVLDYKKQTEYVINMNPRTPAKSVTLYDFKQRTIAYKDLTNRECFLGRLTHETLSEESHALQDVKNPVEVKPKVRSLDPKMPALTPTEIRNIAGQKTAVFCRKMNTWLLMPEKVHSINKRETDEEFEEHTLQYHGHRSSQYSHYERQTRRRFRNRGHASQRRRSRTKESVAEKENGRVAVSEQNSIPHHSNKQPLNSPYFDPDHFNGAVDSSKQNPSADYGTHQNPFPLNQRNFDGNETFNSKASSDKESSSKPVISQENFRYPSTDDNYPPPDGISLYPRRYYLNSDENGDRSFLNNGIESDSTEHVSKPLHANSHLAKLRSDDNDLDIETNSFTTISPESFNHLRTDHPNVHSSLLHLLPLYKPLGREFDFPQESVTRNQSTNQAPTDKQRNIESEAHDSSTHFVPATNRFIHFTDVNNTSNDPDVSVNVLEVPRITKEFENIQNNNSSTGSSQHHNKILPSSLNINPSLTDSLIHRSHSDRSIAIHENGTRNIINIRQEPKDDRNEISFYRNRNHLSETEIFTTTEFPALTTRAYFIPERTTSDSSYVPSVHTAFRNLEDFNSFQIFPNYVENNVAPTTTETSSNAFLVDKFIDSNAGKSPQDLTLAASHPLIKESENTNSNQRSDIPTDDYNGKTLSNNLVESKAEQKSFPLNNYNKTGEDIFPHKIRYQNALRDFKPDEIVIDIENIPTHTPPPVTAGFHQRILTTIQPTIKAFSTDAVRSDTARRVEQTSITSWRSHIPTTKIPRRRINNKSRVPVQSSSIPFVHSSSPNHNRNKFPSPHLNQLTGMRHFSSSHQTNRHQFYYPSHPIPPSNVHMPPEINQLHHVNHLNNLPPGVSVHPRHPQAPFADMVHSNRPPTMPILNDSQEPLKPHRQRHHRKKDRVFHSCCRLRGNSGALQSCCRNGGPCCSRPHRFVQPSNCCSSSKVNRQIIPANQIQPPIKTANKILPPVRTEKTHRSEVDNKDRCQKEKMCRTLYESTQQVMVCRNAHVEGC